MDQARRAVRHAFAPELYPERASKLLPTGVYTIPEASMIGETEEALQRDKVDYVAGRGHYRSSARGRIIGDVDGLVHIGLMAMLMEASVEIFDEACFNIPTLGQLYKVAALDAAGAR